MSTVPKMKLEAPGERQLRTGTMRSDVLTGLPNAETTGDSPSHSSRTHMNGSDYVARLNGLDLPGSSSA